MCDVYRNAYLTIAASRAASDSEGFLKPRPPVYSSLRVISPSGKVANIYLRNQRLGYSDSKDTIDSRAWTLQERWLSRRQLRFCRNAIYWECQATTWHEAHRDKLDSYIPPKYLKGLLNYSKSASYNSGWYSLVREYSARQLSHESDKLPALSGLADAVAKHTNYRYCAGLWWEQISTGLSWSSGPAWVETASKRPACYIAPSWSWASVLSSVTFLRGYDIIPYQLESVSYIDCQVKFRGSNPYGEVESGWLRLKAVRLPLSRKDFSVTFRAGIVERTQVLSSITYDCKEDYIRQDLSVLFLWRETFLSEDTGLYRTSADGSRETVLHGIAVCKAKDQPSHACEVARMQTGFNDLYERVALISMEASERMEDLIFQQAPEEIVLV
jgi:hypothetical protein